jgi:assimilatory nitrate reductase catalytic subunit
MIAEVARRMGWGTAFPYRSPAEIFREHAALSAFENKPPSRRVFDIGALASLTGEEYDQMQPVLWPLPAGTSAPSGRGSLRLFGEGTGFPTPDGRARFVPTPLRQPGFSVSNQWPLLLNTGRLRDQWHTMTRTGRLPRLMAHQGEPALDVHPADAARFDLEDRGLASVESIHGSVILPVRVVQGLREGEVFVPIH